MSESDNQNENAADAPRIFALTRRGGGWDVSRRQFLSAAAAGAAATSADESRGQDRMQPTPDNRRRDVSQSDSACDGIYAHADKVTTLAISSDSRRLVTAGRDNLLKLWALPEGALIDTLATTPDGPITAAVFHPEGEMVYCIQGSRLMSVATTGGSPTTIESMAGLFTVVATSPAGDLLVAGDNQGGVSVWNIADRPEQPDKVFSRQVAGGADVTSLVIRPSRDLLIVGSRPSGANPTGLAALSLSASERVTYGDPDGPAAETIAMNPEMTILARTGTGNAVILWAAHGEMLASLDLHSDTVQDLVFSADGRVLLTASLDRTVRGWSMPDGQLLGTVTIESPRIDRLRVSPDGRMVVTATDKSVQLWSLLDGRRIACLMDIAATPSDEEGITYKVKTETGQTITYTLPCGSPIPAGAVCVCNCVPGSYTVSVPTRSPPTTTTHVYWYPN